MAHAVRVRDTGAGLQPSPASTHPSCTDHAADGIAFARHTAVIMLCAQNKAPRPQLPCRAAWLMASTAGFLMRRSLVTA